MRVRTEEDFPQQWAQTQFALAVTHASANNTTDARHAMQNAVKGFRAVGLEQEADRAEAFLKREDWQL